MPRAQMELSLSTLVIIVLCILLVVGGLFFIYRSTGKLGSLLP